MVIKSYDKTYLEDVEENIGAMLEYATSCGYEVNDFWLRFINSKLASKIENGNIRYLCGCSGMDYIDLVINKKLISKNINSPLTFNKYYWAGLALTNLQYETGYSFYYINEYLPINRVIELYYPLHEADIVKFIECAKTYFPTNKETNLKKIRIASGLSQQKLASKANVDLRSIQMYEQKRNDINKAQAETLFKISKVLMCKVEDLLEIN